MSRICILLLLSIATCARAEDTLLGAGIRTRPAYDGSRSQRTDIVPMISYYGTPWFVRTTEGVLEGGARLEFAKDSFAGAQVAYEAGPRGEDPSASLGFHVELDRKIGPAPVSLLVRLRERFEHERQTQVDVRLTVGVYQDGPVSAGVYAQSTWSSAAWTQAYYGVRDPGVLINSLGVIGGYELGRRWVALGSMEVGRLSGDVARSPYVQQRSTYYASAGLAYRF